MPFAIRIGCPNQAEFRATCARVDAWFAEENPAVLRSYLITNCGPFMAPQYQVQKMINRIDPVDGRMTYERCWETKFTELECDAFQNYVHGKIAAWAPDDYQNLYHDIAVIEESHGVDRILYSVRGKDYRAVAEFCMLVIFDNFIDYVTFKLKAL